MLHNRPLNRNVTGCLRALLFIALLGCPPIGMSDATETSPWRTYRLETDKDFHEVIQDLDYAIGHANFRITGRNRIGNVIGSRYGIAFPEATVIHFCNLSYARALLEITMDFLIYMPCRIAVSQTGNKVRVEASLVPDSIHPDADALVTEVNTILRTIVDTAVEKWD